MVFASGVPLVMAGLDVTHHFLVNDARIAEIDAMSAGGLAKVLADLFASSPGRNATHDHMVGAKLHDPLAVLALTHRQLFTSSERHVAVETHGELTSGMTVIDRRDLKERPAPNCTELESVDSDAARRLIVDAITQASAGAPTPSRANARTAAPPSRSASRATSSSAATASVSCSLAAAAGRIGQLPVGRRSRERR